MHTHACMMIPHSTVTCIYTQHAHMRKYAHVLICTQAHMYTNMIHIQTTTELHKQLKGQTRQTHVHIYTRTRTIYTHTCSRADTPARPGKPCRRAAHNDSNNKNNNNSSNSNNNNDSDSY